MTKETKMRFTVNASNVISSEFPNTEQSNEPDARKAAQEISVWYQNIAFTVYQVDDNAAEAKATYLNGVLRFDGSAA